LLFKIKKHLRKKARGKRRLTISRLRSRKDVHLHDAEKLKLSVRNYI